MWPGLNAVLPLRYRCRSFGLDLRTTSQAMPAGTPVPGQPPVALHMLALSTRYDRQCGNFPRYEGRRSSPDTFTAAVTKRTVDDAVSDA
eukprot:NODE_2013_length_2312_cov_5.650801.p6 GENE.NODE_2013_length_2312_cov_5.650801~~NODE_2013_length_2312_cov_5.650801.p6  ORF type:complete len:89 (+),score=1.88 NODE_2013_length_2312_cov_5.650801:1214-1480(+)